MLTYAYTLVLFTLTIATNLASKHLSTADVFKRLSKDEQEASQLVQRAIIAASRKKTRSNLRTHNKLLALLNQNHYFLNNKKHLKNKAYINALKHKIHRKVKIPNLTFSEPADDYQEPRIGYHVFVSNGANRANTKAAPTYHDIERDVNKMLESAKKLKNESVILQENALYLEKEASALKAQSETKQGKQEKTEKGKKFKSTEVKVKPIKEDESNVLAAPAEAPVVPDTNRVTAVITPDELFGVKEQKMVPAGPAHRLIKTDTTFVTTSDGTKVAFQDEPYEVEYPNSKVSVSNFQSSPISPLASVETVPSFATNHHSPEEAFFDNINNVLIKHPVATEAPVVLKRPAKEEAPVVIQTLEGTPTNHAPVFAAAADIAHHDTQGVVQTGHPDKLTAHVFEHPCETHVDKDTGFPVSPYHHVDPDHLKSGCHGQGPERGGSAARPELPMTQVVRPPKLTPGIPPIVPVETGYPVYHIPPSSEEPAIPEFIKPAPPCQGINPYEILTSSELNGTAYKTQCLPPAVPIVHHPPKVIPVVQTFFGELTHEKTRPQTSTIGAKKSSVFIKTSTNKLMNSKKRKQGKNMKKFSRQINLNKKQKAILQKWHQEKHKLLKKNMSKKEITIQIKKFLRDKTKKSKKSLRDKSKKSKKSRQKK